MPKVNPTPLSQGSGLPVVTLPSSVASKARSQAPGANLDRDAQLRQDNRLATNQSINTMRLEQSAPAMMRKLVEADGLASTAAVNLVAMAESGWRLQVYHTWTQEFSSEGLLAAETIISALDSSWDYTKKFDDRRGIGLLIETALWDTLQTGGIGLELALDAFRIPRAIYTIPFDQIKWKSDGKGGKYPVQRPLGGEEVSLNYPTVFIAESLKSANRAYTMPLMAPGVQRLIQYEDFIEDMWRVVRQAGEPRLVAKLNYEKVISSAPAETRNDPAKLTAYLNEYQAGLTGVLNSLAPQDALVVYDLAEVDKIDTNGEKKDFKELLGELSGQAASALKSNASLMGMRQGGSQNVATTESMISTKLAAIIQKPVAEVFSRALTLAVRLYGVDAYVSFEFLPIDLRPWWELAAHRQIEQNITLELLSLGRITDAEAQVRLGLGSLPADAEALSGTGFYSTKAPDTVPVSTTNARNTAITPQSASAGGKNNQATP